MEARTYFPPPWANLSAVCGQHCRGSGWDWSDLSRVTSDFMVTASNEHAGPQEMKRAILCPWIHLWQGSWGEGGLTTSKRKIQASKSVSIKRGCIQPCLKWPDRCLKTINTTIRLLNRTWTRWVFFPLSKVYICSAQQWGQSLFESSLNLCPFLCFLCVHVCVRAHGNHSHLITARTTNLFRKPWLKLHHLPQHILESCHVTQPVFLPFLFLFLISSLPTLPPSSLCSLYIRSRPIVSWWVTEWAKLQHV